MSKNLESHSVYLLEHPRPGNILLRDSLDRLFRQKRLITVLATVWTVAIGAYVFLSPAKYEEEIRFLINNNRAAGPVTADVNTGAVYREYVDEAMLATEIQLMSNIDLIRRVAEKAQLVDGSDPEELEEAAEDLEKEIKIAPVLKSSMIKASYSSSNPEEVETVLRTLADEYLEAHLAARSTPGAYALFEEQATYYQKQLQELEQRQLEFQNRNNIVQYDQQREANLEKLMDLRAAYLDNQSAESANASRLEEVRRQLASLSDRITTQARRVPNQYSVERLNTMLVELENRRTELLVKFRPEERMVKQVEAQIADTRAALDSANNMISTEETTDVNPLRQSLENEAAQAELKAREYAARAQNLQHDISTYRGTLNSLQGADAEHAQLLRELREAEDNFFLYSKKAEEARISDVMDTDKIANAVLIQPARFPVLPQKRLSITMAALYILGLGLIVAIGFAVGITRPNVYTSWELEAVTGLPVLASVPQQAVARPRGRLAAKPAYPELIS